MKTLLAVVAVLLGSMPVASGQTFPSRTLALVVPFSAGGPTDTIGRIIAQRMGTALGQTVVVENVTGAGGTIAGGRVARAAPDGYTLGIGHLGTHVVAGAAYELKYDVYKDFEPLAMVAVNPQLIVAKKGIPASDLRELIAWVKTNQDKVSVGIGGFGSPSHVAAVYFQNIIGAKVQIVPYRGAAPAMNDLLAGHVDMMFDQAANSLPQVRAGTIKAYAVTASARLAAAPNIPTVDEAGLAKFYMSIWHGIWAPRGTPGNVTARLNAAIEESLADPAVRRRLLDLGQEIPPREQQTREYLAAYHKAEIEKWWPMIKAAGIKGE